MIFKGKTNNGMKERTFAVTGQSSTYYH